MGCNKTILRGKPVAIQYYFKKQKHQMDSLTLHLKQLEKEKEEEEEEEQQQQKTKIRRRKEIIKIRAEINEEEMKETIIKINKTKRCLFEMIKKKLPNL